MKKIFFLVIVNILLFFNNSFSQGENNVWYFGNGTGLDFNSGTPVALSNGQMNTVEGCASISTSTGNLLFYTDGSTVWNSNHVPMANGTGLMGHFSSSQSAIIFKKPGSNTIYYIFTADSEPYFANPGTSGIRYSEVDITLNGGLGDVTSNKNVLVFAPALERLVAVRHCNNRDVWVIAHERGTNAYRSYLVTSSGVTATPVVSNIGVVVSAAPSTNNIGYLKASPNGKKLAATTYTPTNKVELFDFDNTTGVISNLVDLTQSGAFTTHPYGLEFSPDGTKLYNGHQLSGRIYQFDLCAGSSAAIQSSATLVGSGVAFVGALQLGPDNKIYAARNGASFLGVIDSPNALGAACTYINNGVSLGNDTCQSGLPNLFKIRIVPTFTSSIICLTANFTAPSVTQTNCSGSSSAINSLLWNFGDPASGASDTSTSPNPIHNYPSAGTYTATLILNYGCGSDTIQQTITITNAGANITLSPVICSGDSYILPNGTSVNTAGTYNDTLPSGTGCDTIITINLTVTPPIINSTNAVICQGDVYTLPDGTPVSVAGTYSDTLNSSSGCDSILSVVLSVNVPPSITISPDVTIQPGDTTTLVASGGSIYNWTPSTGLSCDTCSSTFAFPTITTTYCVVVADSIGCIDTACVKVDVNDPCIDLADIVIPNVFTPNFDGNNDEFYVGKGLDDCIKSYEMKIYNRWGILVFESKGLNVVWDGRISSGSTVVSGTYYYVLTISDKKGEQENFAGFVTLIQE